MQGTVGEILETYREAKYELLRKAQAKAAETGSESSLEVIGNSPEEWAYFLIVAGEE